MNKITELKKLLEGINIRVLQAVEGIGELEDRPFGMIKSEEQKEERIKRF